MKNKMVLITVLALFILVGCASLKEAMMGVTPEQQASTTAQVQAVTQPYIPQPYQIPASVILGYLACVGYNWFKKKTSA